MATMAEKHHAKEHSSIRPIRIPRPTPAQSSKEHGASDPSSEPHSNLPAGWSLNERDEILNEEGLVMMDIQEELPAEQPALASNTSTDPVRSSTSPSGGTIPGSMHDEATGTSPHQLPAHISSILDQLELEEELEAKLISTEGAQPSQSDDKAYARNFITPGELGQEVDHALNLGKKTGQFPSSQEDLKNWGKTGLDGLRNIFKTASSLSVPSTCQQVEQSTDDNPSASPAPPAPTSILSGPRLDKSTPLDGPGPAKPPQKKSVTFAPETYTNPPKSVSSSAILPDLPRPSPGIVLSDIVERPITQPTPPISTSSTQQFKPTKHEVNGKNAHLNPRLASLLPRSLQARPHSYSHPVLQHSESRQLVEQEDDESSGQDQHELDSDEIDDGSSTWSVDEDDAEGGSSWPPEDLDIQTALDLRQAALEYHTKRQGLGLGRGTGPLGGNRPPGSDDGSEWVPLDTRVQAPGVPRKSNGQSRFKTGRPLPPLDGTNPECLGDEKVVNGKLFGAAPILEGPAPTMGAAVHQLPGRSAEFTEVDDELTAEELELLKSRLEVLGMDEERRNAAEKAGSELMAWMEKARTGQVKLEDDDQSHLESETLPHHQAIITPAQQSISVDGPLRNEAPPVVKIAPKSRALKSRLTIPKNPSRISSAPSSPKRPSESSNFDSTVICPTIDQVSPETNFNGQTPLNNPSASTTTTKKLSRFKASKMLPNA
ncbi:hypothetical protein VP01_2560g1 [Puccinia sorghi]|uniref:DUF3835 domain-containing protein n=1 Tax=Puccinia sorghi TaxID=27349 RepID=A0A0L6V584_9BASI|nr:hypothetical protein VP01_2560g1 [Puccinia sorghi]